MRKRLSVGVSLCATGDIVDETAVLGVNIFLEQSIQQRVESKNTKQKRICIHKLIHCLKENPQSKSEGCGGAFEVSLPEAQKSPPTKYSNQVNHTCL